MATKISDKSARLLREAATNPRTRATRGAGVRRLGEIGRSADELEAAEHVAQRRKGDGYVKAGEGIGEVGERHPSEISPAAVEPHAR